MALNELHHLWWMFACFVRDMQTCPPFTGKDMGEEALWPYMGGGGGERRVGWL